LFFFFTRIKIVVNNLLILQVYPSKERDRDDYVLTIIFIVDRSKNIK